MVIPILAVLWTSSCIPKLGSEGAAQTTTPLEDAPPPPSNTEAGSTMKLEMLEYEFVGPSPAGIRDVIGVVANRSGYSIADIEFDLNVLNSDGEIVEMIRDVSGPAYMADGETAVFRASLESIAEDPTCS